MKKLLELLNKIMKPQNQELVRIPVRTRHNWEQPNRRR